MANTQGVDIVEVAFACGMEEHATCCCFCFNPLPMTKLRTIKYTIPKTGEGSTMYGCSSCLRMARGIARDNERAARSAR